MPFPPTMRTKLGQFAKDELKGCNRGATLQVSVTLCRAHKLYQWSQFSTASPPQTDVFIRSPFGLVWHRIPPYSTVISPAAMTRVISGTQ